jgi:hypothetical protein
MRIDRSHALWILFVAAATVGCGALFLANFYPDKLPFRLELPALFGEVPPRRNTFGGTPLGLLFGGVSLLIFVLAAFLGVRKKRRLWPIGNVKFWLQAHIWLTVLTIPLVLYHCGFHFGGFHTSALMALYTVVMGSGFLGVALQQVMPRMMRERLGREVVFEEIPHLCGQLLESALKVREELAGDLRKMPAGAKNESLNTVLQFVDREVLPFLSGAARRNSRLADEKTSGALFRVLANSVVGPWRGRVEELGGWCEQRRMMNVQTRMQHWLHGWLLVHVPISFVLLVWTFWHAWVAVRFLVVLP